MPENTKLDLFKALGAIIDADETDFKKREHYAGANRFRVLRTSIIIENEDNPSALPEFWRYDWKFLSARVVEITIHYTRGVCEEFRVELRGQAKPIVAGPARAYAAAPILPDTDK